MKVVIQRVLEASVEVDKTVVGKIGKGLLVFIGIGKEDTKETADAFINKLIHLRIFEDANGKTNLSLHDVQGSLLLVSQFTLYADCRKGNRPSFTQAGDPKMAEELYEYMIEVCRQKKIPTEHGILGADMKVSLVNDGPFPICF